MVKYELYWKCTPQMDNQKEGEELKILEKF